MLLFVYGIDTSINRLQKQLGKNLGLKVKGIDAVIENKKIGYVGYNPFLDNGYETIKSIPKSAGEGVRGLVYKVTEQQLDKLDQYKAARYVRKVKLVQIQGQDKKKKCFVYLAQ